MAGRDPSLAGRTGVEQLGEAGPLGIGLRVVAGAKKMFLCILLPEQSHLWGAHGGTTHGVERAWFSQPLHMGRTRDGWII